MLASLIIVFREVLEAGLIVGIVLAATQGVIGRGFWISIGLVAGVAGACIVAVFADVISDMMAGNGQEVFNAAVLGTAVVMLGWHNAWMARHGREHVAEMKEIGRAVDAGERPPQALAVVVGMAVLREGSEVVLFLAGVASSDNGGAVNILSGSFAGLALGALVSLLMYQGLVRIPARHLFAVMTWLITLLAAGMGAQAAAYLSRAGVIDVGGAELWDTSAILRDDSLIGQVLHILVGYTDRPTALQAVTYLIVVAAILLFTSKAKRGTVTA